MKTALLAAAAALVSLSGTANAAFVDGGFETQGTGVSGFCYFAFNAGQFGACPNGAWTGVANSGLHEDNNPFWPGVDSPEGSRYAFVQLSGSFSQTFTAATSGNFTLNWQDAGRPDIGSSGGNQTYQVFLDGNSLGTFSTTSGQAWIARASGSNFALNAGQTYTLTFAGQTTTNDNTSYIDNVSFAAAVVPEPAQWALMIGGFGLVGGAMRRRSVKVVTA